MCSSDLSDHQCRCGRLQLVVRGLHGAREGLVERAQGASLPQNLLLDLGQAPEERTCWARRRRLVRGQNGRALGVEGV